ncbi:Anaphase-promoting complex subunit cdc20 [Cucumispora dikerogammari]|nr:Anaphase-promoting complex subunit cdc20 [Cucumispora dikerogammari]
MDFNTPNNIKNNKSLLHRLDSETAVRTSLNNISYLDDLLVSLNTESNENDSYNMNNNNLNNKIKLISYPIKILKIQKPSDDFYSNTLDWKRNLIILSITRTLYLINSITYEKNKLHSFNNPITSLKFYDSENILVGLRNGKIFLFNVNKLCYFKLPPPYSISSKITVFEVKNQNVFTGSEDKMLRIFDIRNNFLKKYNVNCLKYHKLEVTGIAVHKSLELFATGGNDNKVFVFDMRYLNCDNNITNNIDSRSGFIQNIYSSIRNIGLNYMNGTNRSTSTYSANQTVNNRITNNRNINTITNNRNINTNISNNKYILSYTHLGAIRGLTFTPHNLLLSGGGSADQTIQIWNLTSLTKLNQRLFNSQICNLHWLTTKNQLISTHGYSHNDIKISSMELNLKSVYPPQSSRVLNFKVNGAEDQFVTACSDKELRFWSLL